MIREAARTTFISACLFVILGAVGIYAVDTLSRSNDTAQYLVTWTGDAPPTKILYLAHGAAYPVDATEIAQGGHQWSYNLPYSEGVKLHIEVTQPLPYHGITTAQILINNRVQASADTRFGRKSIILDA